MGKLLELGAKKVAGAVGGVVLALVWMSFGGGGGEYQELDRVPTRAFGGGAGEVTVDIRVSEPAYLHASFSRWDASDDTDESTYASEELDPGQHLRSVDIGAGTYLYFEVGMENPPVGATIEWTVYLDGEEIHRESDRLEEPLEDGYGFFIQLEADSIDDLRRWTE